MPRRAWPLPWATAALAIATLLGGAAAHADRPIRMIRPPKLEAPKPGTIGERAALASEEAASSVPAADLSRATATDPLAGKPIARVETVTMGGLWPSDERVTTVKIGEPWGADAGRRAARELLQDGRFARVGVEAYGENGGVVLRLALLPRRVIASISLSGGALGRADTLEAAGLAEGGEVTATSLETARAKITQLYKTRGFPSATVHVDATETDKSEAVVSIDIEPGKPLLITKRSFAIDKAVQAEVGKLRERYKVDPARNVFEEILRHTPIFAIAPIAFEGSLEGVRADEPALADADRDLAEVLRQNGFPRAEVAHLVIKKGDHAELSIKITAGPRLVPVFDGNRAFDADQLSKALDLSKGDASRPADLADRLHDFYVKRGYLDAEIDVSERGEPKDPVHYLSFRIRENQRVRVTKRSFPCLTGELSADDIGAEIDTFLEEDLPRADGFSPGDPRTLLQIFGPTEGGGGRPRPPDINPSTTFAPASYDRALKHIKDLYYSKGYLNAVIGPVSLMRARCDPAKTGEGCVPEAIPPIAPRCVTDEIGLPVPEPELTAKQRCVPDPSRHVECASEVTVVLPIAPGPRSVLYDVAFEGNGQVKADARAGEDLDRTEQRLAKVAALSLGKPLSSTELDAARQRVLDYYLQHGYAYADVRVSIEPSPDRSRARAKFTIAEHEVVIVTDVVVKGAKRTDVDLIKSRVAFEKGDPYRQDRARVSEERIAQLGPFTSVALSLEDPEVPQREKRVVVTVVEQLPQYLDPRVGFSTGEGVRFAFEYGHRNLGGRAIAGSLRLQLAYLPDFLIPSALLPAYRKTPLDNIAYRMERRNALTLAFPDIGLGSNATAAIDLIDLRDLQRDYALGREAIVPSVTFRPGRQVSFVLSASAEYNDVFVFNTAATTETLRLLKVPEGKTVAFSQRVGATWDRRNNPFAATKGWLLAGSVEHVTALPTEKPEDTTAKTTFGDSDFFKFSGKAAAYVPLFRDDLSLAFSVSAGMTLKLNGETYPDRLFFLGGVDTIRSFAPESVVPQDIAYCIAPPEVRSAGGAWNKSQCFKDGKRLSIEDVPIRGGDAMVVSRVELRFPIPVSSSLQGGLFFDFGNLWKQRELMDFRFRTGLGLGIRIATPIGPIAFDYGFNLERYRWEDFGAPNFSIGLF